MDDAGESHTDHDTAQTVDEMLVEYFSPDQFYELVIPDKGKPYKKVTEPPTLEGFCAQNNMTLAELYAQASPRTLEICGLKLHHILVSNGLLKNYDSSLTGLTMKNKFGWSEKSENRTTHEAVLSEADKRMLERAGILSLESGKVIDVSDEVNVSR